MHKERNWKFRAPDRLEILNGEVLEYVGTVYAFEGRELPEDRGEFYAGKLFVFKEGLAFLSGGESAKRSFRRSLTVEGAQEIAMEVAKEVIPFGGVAAALLFGGDAMWPPGPSWRTWRNGSTIHIPSLFPTLQ